MDSNSGGTMQIHAKSSLSRFRFPTSIALLWLTLLVWTGNSSASDNRMEANLSHNHLSWTRNGSRFDFIFETTNSTIQNILKLESDSNDYLTSSLPACQNHSACLFQDGKLVDYFQIRAPQTVQSSSSDRTVYSSTKPSSNNDQQRDNCDQSFTIFHYCSTHWNPPAYLYKNKCSHAIEWHSPMRCHSNSTNNERPCYIYDPEGKLIDLTPWIKSDGSSYKVDTSILNTIGTDTKFPVSTELKGFYINVCNEAHDMCGPNVSSCFMDPKEGLVEAGFNNLTSIKYDVKETNTILLKYQGHVKEQCENGRVKTVIRFVCKKKNLAREVSSVGPKLISSNSCENVVEWETIHACPLGDISSPVLPDCRLKYDPLEIDIDVMQITKNVTKFEVPNVGKSNMNMVLGICKSLPKALECEGKQTELTSACLLDTNDKSMKRSAKNSQIVGSIIKSTLRLADDRLYLEATTINTTCNADVGARPGFNVTRQLGVRIEFVCSANEQSSPKYLNFDDCRYVFEWGTPLMCFETLSSTKKIETSDTLQNKLSSIMPDMAETLSPKPTVSHDDQLKKSPIDQHNETLKDAKQISDETVHQDAQHNYQESPVISQTPKQISPEVPKMNPVHKFFMISLIVMSLVAFLLIILVLDKKTRLRIPLNSIRRQARQTFQPQPIPYSRVVNDLDL